MLTGGWAKSFIFPRKPKFGRHNYYWVTRLPQWSRDVSKSREITWSGSRNFTRVGSRDLKILREIERFTVRRDSFSRVGHQKFLILFCLDAGGTYENHDINLPEHTLSGQTNMADHSSCVFTGALAFALSLHAAPAAGECALAPGERAPRSPCAGPGRAVLGCRTEFALSSRVQRLKRSCIHSCGCLFP